MVMAMLLFSPDSLGQCIYMEILATSYLYGPLGWRNYLNVHATISYTYLNINKKRPKWLVKAIDREFSETMRRANLSEISTASGLLWLKMYDKLNNWSRSYDLKAK